MSFRQYNYRLLKDIHVDTIEKIMNMLDGEEEESRFFKALLWDIICYKRRQSKT